MGPSCVGPEFHRRRVATECVTTEDELTSASGAGLRSTGLALARDLLLLEEEEEVMRQRCLHRCLRRCSD